MKTSTLTVLSLVTITTLTGSTLASSNAGGTLGNSTGLGRGSVATQTTSVTQSAHSKLSPAARRVDIDRSGTLTANDIQSFVSLWNKTVDSDDLTCDVDGNGKVDADDISAFIALWSAAIAV